MSQPTRSNYSYSTLSTHDIAVLKHIDSKDLFALKQLTSALSTGKVLVALDKRQHKKLISLVGHTRGRFAVYNDHTYAPVSGKRKRTRKNKLLRPAV